MNLAKTLAKEAKQKGICESWHNHLKSLESKQEMVEMYVKGIDFCLSNDYPSNDFIRTNFKGSMEDFGVFLDDNINITNFPRCVALGATHGRVEVSSYNVCEVFAKNKCNIEVIAKDNAFVEVDIFDNAILTISAQDRAKVHINRYGGTIRANPTQGSAIVKIVEKHKKTY